MLENELIANFSLLNCVTVNTFNVYEKKKKLNSIALAHSPWDFHDDLQYRAELCSCAKNKY